MIPAYEDEWKAYGKTDEQYIAQTTFANTKQGVIDYVNRYMQKNECVQEVVDYLQAVIADDVLLEKTHVVWDGSYRNCVTLIRPDGILQTGRVNFGDNNPIDFYRDNAEIFFLNMTKETWREVDEWCRRMLERDDYYDDGCDEVDAL